MFDFGALKSSGMIVTFIKKDGTERQMLCTTNLNYIPQEKHPKGINTTKKDGLHKVFDVEISDWRSFNECQVINAINV